LALNLGASATVGGLRHAAERPIPTTPQPQSENINMGDRGSKDKGKKEKQNAAKLSTKEKKRLKQEKKKQSSTTSSLTR